MGDKNCPSYLYLKGKTFYFNRHVPLDLKGHYKTKRIRLCLKTASPFEAAKAARSIAQRLDDYWMALRLSSMDIPALHLLRQKPLEPSNAPTLSKALSTYLRLKGNNKSDTFFRGARRNIQAVIDVLDDRPIDQYLSSDAAAFRDYSLDRGLTVASVKRNFTTIRSIINLTISEQGLDCKNPFSKVFFPDLDDVNQRKPFPNDLLKLLQSRCRAENDSKRWLIALISDTGMRLAEAVGLAVDDIKLDKEIPYIDIKPHPWRSLKTKGSQRKIPLVGEALWAARQIKASNKTKFAFPEYTNAELCNANSASAALNRWVQTNISKDYVMHSLRHSMRDRLREVQCPAEIIDQIGGWSSRSIGESYGEGHSLNKLILFMEAIAAYL